MQNQGLTRNIAAGVAAGAAGTALMQGMMMGSQKLAPQALPPMRDDPGHFMVKQAERLLPPAVQEKVPEKLEALAAYALAFGYGMTLASLYSLMRPQKKRRLFRRRPPEPNLWLDGAVFGAIAWGLGYLGWLPATKLAPPVWKQQTKQILPNIFSHVLFGLATVGLLRWLRRKL